MNKKLKPIAAISAVLMCGSIFGMTAYADEISGGEGDYVDNPSYVNPGTDSSNIGGDISSDIGGGDVSSSDIGGDPGTDSSYVEPDSSSDYGDISSSYNDDYSSSYSDYTDDYNSYSSDYSDEYSESDYYSSYVGGGQTYVVPDSTAPSAALYEVNGKVDGKELNSSDWDDISNSLKNASASDDGDDFSFIQNNTSGGDNGQWMLFAGIGCLVLSAAGIVYVVVSSARNRKMAAKGSRVSGNPAVAAAGASGRHNGDYGDGYSVSGSSSHRKKVHSSKFDTADVKLPKSAHAKGGKRYK